MEDIPVPVPARPVRFMDRLRAFMRAQHMAYRTEKTYCLWVRDLIRFHQMRRPEESRAPEVEAWLAYLAGLRSVAVNPRRRL